MTDQAFEARVERVLRRYAETAVRPIDAVDVAQRSMVSRVETFPRPFGMSWLAAAAIVAALLLAAMLVVSGGSRWPALFDGRTTPTESPASPRPLAEDLFGPWLADIPADLSLATDGDAERMSLVIDGVGSLAYVSLFGDDREFMPARTETSTGNDIRFITRGTTQPIDVAGVELRGCTPGCRSRQLHPAQGDHPCSTCSPSSRALVCRRSDSCHHDVSP